MGGRHADSILFIIDTAIYPVTNIVTGPAGR